MSSFFTIGWWNHNRGHEKNVMKGVFYTVIGNVSSLLLFFLGRRDEAPPPCRFSPKNCVFHISESDHSKVVPPQTFRVSGHKVNTSSSILGILGGLTSSTDELRKLARSSTRRFENFPALTVRFLWYSKSTKETAQLPYVYEFRIKRFFHIRMVVGKKQIIWVMHENDKK